jgi:hypothetical protein
MQTPHRLGLWIAVAVFGLLLTDVVVAAFGQFVTAPITWNSAWTVILQLAVSGGIVAALGKKLRDGWRFLPAAGFAVLALIAVLIGLGYWMLTMHSPNDESVQRAGPWLLAWGALNILAGGLLFLPPVRRVLQAQREAMVAAEEPLRQEQETNARLSQELAKVRGWLAEEQRCRERLETENRQLLKALEECRLEVMKREGSA